MVADPDEGGLGGGHSRLMSFNFTSLRYLSTSARDEGLGFLDVLFISESPILVKRSFTSAAPMAVFKALFRVSMIAGGVPRGAISTLQAFAV